MLYCIKSRSAYWLMGKITARDCEQLGAVARIMRDLGKPWTLVISSEGGTFDINLLKELRLSLFTAHVAYYAEGSASLIAMAATQIKATPYTKVILNRPIIDPTSLPDPTHAPLARKQVDYVWAAILAPIMTPFCLSQDSWLPWHLDGASAPEVEVAEEIEENTLGEFVFHELEELDGEMFGLTGEDAAKFTETLSLARDTYCQWK